MKLKQICTKWILPRGFIEIYKDLKKYFYKDSLHRSFNRRDIDKRCFILASGPSINTQNLKLLENEDVIAVSHVHRHPDINIIKPKYHVLAPFHHPFKFDDAKKYFDDFKKFYQPKNIKIFLGYRPYIYSFKDFLNQTNEYSQFEFEYINYSNSTQLDEANYKDYDLWDIGKKPFGCRTVVYSAIQLAWKLGYREIYLLGCDHDYLLNLDRVGEHRFYSDKDGISDKEHLSEFTSERWFYEYYMRWKQYRLMKEFLNEHGVEVFNATNGGMLDVFPRVKYEDLFEENI